MSADAEEEVGRGPSKVEGLKVISEGLGGFLVRFRALLLRVKQGLDPGCGGFDQPAGAGIEPAALGFIGAVPAFGDRVVVIHVRRGTGERVDQAQGVADGREAGDSLGVRLGPRLRDRIGNEVKHNRRVSEGG